MAKVLSPRHIADLHLGHQLVCDARGFDSVAEHDEAVMSLLAQVPERADLYLHGGLSAGGAGAEQHAFELLAPLIQARSGATVLVLGNHDRAHPCNRNGRRHLRAYHQVFDAVVTHDQVRHEGRPVLLSHFPYAEDHVADRDLSQWYLRDHGTLLVHGHLHAERAVEAHRPNQVSVSYESLADFGGAVPSLAQIVRLADEARAAGLWGDHAR